MDTDNNVADFANLAVTPHNVASGVSQCCLATPASKSTWGQIKTLYR
jgi:hypothetical protein